MFDIIYLLHLFNLLNDCDSLEKGCLVRLICTVFVPAERVTIFSLNSTVISHYVRIFEV